jgi:sugar lactone lactonase YvrE
VVTTLAGLAEESGSADGTGSAARFNGPWNVAVDSFGNIYVADTGNCTIRKVTPAGVVTTLAGTAGQAGSADGTGSEAQFGCPGAVATDGAGNVYVADCTGGTIRKGIPSIVGPALILTQPQNASTVAGQNTSFQVSAAGTAPLSYRWQVSTDGGSTWMNLDEAAPFSGTATASLTITGASALWNGNRYSCLVSNPIPSSVASDAAILSVIPSATTAATGEAVISNGFTAAWSGVSGATGYRLDVSADSSFGSFVTGYQDLDVGNAVSVAISGLSANTTYYYRVRAIDGAGAGADSGTIKVITAPAVVITAPLTVTTLAGTVLGAGSSDGTGSAAGFYYPAGVAADNAGDLFVADTDNHTIRKVVASTGAVTTLAGLAGSSGSADGTSSDARFNSPSGVAVDAAGNVYVADTMNNTLRMITPQGVVTTLAGSPGIAGSTDDAGSAARFEGPQGLAIDTSNNLYVADTNNHIIRKVVPATGVVTTVAGLGGNSGSADGLGSQGRFNFPSGVAIDGAGNLYVADTENHTIRAISASGQVSTLAGLAGSSGGADGVGSAARFNSPSDLAVDSSGNVYVTDTDNFTIREVVPTTGAVTTLAGVAGTSGSSDGLGSAVRFFHAAGIAVDSSSNLYVADTDNDTLRVGLLAVKPSVQTQPQSQTVTAGGGVLFSVTASGRPAITYQWNFNGAPIDGATSNIFGLSSAQSNNAGNYTVVVSNAAGSVTSDVATLTVSAVPPPPRSGGGGGAPSIWFDGAFALLAAIRMFRRRLRFAA